MVITSSNFIADIFSYVISDLNANINDPLSGSRPTKEKFILTSYPHRTVTYPIVTVKIPNIVAKRAGMQTIAIDMDLQMEIRVWARNQKEKDSISQDIVNRLKNIQFISQTGSQDSGIHNFKIINMIEINEDGDNTPKSRLINVGYTYYNPQ